MQNFDVFPYLNARDHRSIYLMTIFSVLNLTREKTKLQ